MKQNLQHKGVVVLEVQQPNYIIYAHINKINNKAYVGQTNQQPQRRWGSKGNRYKKQNFYQAIQKYGWDNFNHIILEENLTKDEANEREKHWIKYYNSFYNGYNETEGGNNRRLSEKEKEKISQFMKTTRQGSNNPAAKKVICLNTLEIFDTLKNAGDWCGVAPENISFACKNQSRHSGKHPITHENLCWCFLNNYNPLVQAQFELNKNKILNSNHHGQKKPVYQIDLLTDKILNVFDSCAEASRCLFKDASKAKGISRCANGQRAKAYGYKWRFKNENTCI